MAVIRITRYRTDSVETEEVLARRATLLRAVRASFPGLTSAQLGRTDDGTWVDVWRWNSAAELDAALEKAPSLPESQAAFAIVTDATVEQAAVLDER